MISDVNVMSFKTQFQMMVDGVRSKYETAVKMLKTLLNFIIKLYAYKKIFQYKYNGVWSGKYWRRPVFRHIYIMRGVRNSTLLDIIWASVWT